MSYFNPGPGWREVSDIVAAGTDTSLDKHMYWTDGKWHYWVREEPVPPLPTEPNTTIGITAANGASILDDPVFTLRQMSAGLRWWNKRGPHTVEWLQDRITGYKVLSEPRVVTASAVISRVHDLTYGSFNRVPWEQIKQEFGVQS